MIDRARHLNFHSAIKHFFLVRFLQELGDAMAAGDRPGYYVLKLSLCASTWLTLSRPRTDLLHCSRDMCSSHLTFFGFFKQAGIATGSHFNHRIALCKVRRSYASFL